MKALIIAGSLALAPFAQALAGTCPPSIAVCGPGSQEVTQTVNGCPLKSCRSKSGAMGEDKTSSSTPPNGSSSTPTVNCQPKFNQDYPACSTSETLLWSDKTCAFECKSDKELCTPKGAPPDSDCPFTNLWSVTDCKWTCADDPFCPSYFCHGKWVWCGDGLSTPTDNGKFFRCQLKEKDGKPANKAAYGQKMDQLGKELEALRTFDRSCARASDCMAVPTGHKPCGGPSSFLVTSKNNPKAGQLKAKAEEFTALIQAYQQEFESGMGSTCSVEGPPPFACRDKICTAE